jgi:hypothetical protein
VWWRSGRRLHIHGTWRIFSLGRALEKVGMYLEETGRYLVKTLLQL